MEYTDYTIVQFDETMSRLLPRAQEPFEVIGRLVLKYDGAHWTHSEELLAFPHEKTYPNDSFDPMEYAGNPRQAAFLAMRGNECVGSIRVCRRWNGNGFIDDLAIDRAHRGHGAGTLLMDAALKWCRANGLNGLSLETQDWNLSACRFYLKYGFEIGGIDARVYTRTEYLHETAIYFYLSDKKFAC